MEDFYQQLKSNHFTVFAHVLSVVQVSQDSIGRVSLAHFFFWFSVCFSFLNPSPDRIADWFSSGGTVTA